VTVLKSDNANGLFGFDGPCQPAVVPMSVNELNCTVRRDRGTYDTAAVRWLVASLDASVSVSQYFFNYTGDVLFSAEQTRAVSSLGGIWLFCFVICFMTCRMLDMWHGNNVGNTTPVRRSLNVQV